MPKVHEDARIVCACGNVITAQATVKELQVELCSACHPFSTVKQTEEEKPKRGRKKA